MTEEVLGVDLVKSQLAVAAGATLASLGLAQADVPAPRGFAMQLRINMEVMDEKGATKPTGGTLGVFDPPSGPGVRVDTFGYAGYRTSAAFNSLLAKVIVHSPAANWPDVVQKAARALREFRIAGVATNIPFIQAVLAHPDFVGNRISTGFIDTHVAALVGAAREMARPRSSPATAAMRRARLERRRHRPPVRRDRSRCRRRCRAPSSRSRSSEGDMVRPGQQIAVLESMKMEHLVTAPHGGKVTKIAAEAGATLMHGEAILFLEPAEVEGRRGRGRGRRSRPHPSRSRRTDRAPRHHARRQPPRLGRAPAQDQSANGAGKYRAAGR